MGRCEVTGVPGSARGPSQPSTEAVHSISCASTENRPLLGSIALALLCTPTEQIIVIVTYFRAACEQTDISISVDEAMLSSAVI
jgi:hypothetical protein